MSYRVRYTREAKEDFERLYRFLLDQDLLVARRAKDAISKGMEFSRTFHLPAERPSLKIPFCERCSSHLGTADM
ncbi:MAG: type II toxin-antitoxin system RelE/ParE family toxin [Desulfobulbaceae bacterium]|nr:type II toxin-antitoxin system RelE/ParE family toxin [Desulfobulbaceae bacterium]